MQTTMLYPDANPRLGSSELERSLFLAGPTPRSKNVASWRPEAIRILGKIGFDGNVLVPERSDWTAANCYEHQIKWEWAGLDNCTLIVFWVPREMATMPALTTNVEFGLYVRSKPCLYGRPSSAVSCRYLDYLYENATGAAPIDNLEQLMQQAASLVEGLEFVKKMQKRKNS
jgi:hypothetical protein